LRSFAANAKVSQLGLIHICPKTKVARCCMKHVHISEDGAASVADSVMSTSLQFYQECANSTSYGRSSQNVIEELMTRREVLRSTPDTCIIHSPHIRRLLSCIKSF